MATPVIEPGVEKAEKRYSWQFVPPIGCSDEDALTFVDAVIKDGRFARWSKLRMSRNESFYKDRHWFEIPRDLVASSGGGYNFRDIRPRGMAPEEVPPQDNRIALGVDNEVARLVSRELEATCTAERPDPQLEAAAQLSKDILLHDIAMANWPDKRRRFAYDMTCLGTASGVSEWDETATDLTVVASLTASICPSCERKFASTTVPTEYVRAGIPLGGDQGLAPFLHNETLKSVPNYRGNRLAQMTHCPMCERMSPLTDYQVSEDEAKGQSMDLFGNPLGLAVPRGDGFMRVVDQYGLYPQDGGLCEPSDCTIMGLRTIEELEWIAPRIPDEFAEGLEKQDSKDLAKLFPSSGKGADPETYRHHAFVDRVYVQPMDLPGLEMGRRIWRVGGKIVLNDALMVSVNTPVPPGSKMKPEAKKVARWKMSTGRFVSVGRQFWGLTPVDRAVPHQRRLNLILYMGDQLRKRGIPYITVPPNVEIYEREETNGILRYVTVDASSSVNPQWTPKDNIVNVNPITGNAYMAEHDRCIAAIEAVLGPKPTEAGINQPGVKSGDQAELLAEEARQKRVPQEQELNRLHEELWTAHMEQTYAFRTEETEFGVEANADQQERKAYRGTDLLGQVNIKVEATGKMQRSLAQASKTMKAIEMGLVDVMTDEVAKQKALELLDLPPLNEEKSIQVKRAEQAWSEFTREKRIPVIDPAIQDTWIWFMALGKRWQGDDALRMQRTAGWDEVVKALSGWQEKLAEAETYDMQAKATYGGFPPEQWAGIQKQQTDLAMKEGAMMAGARPPVNPPPDGQFLPANLADRLLLLWERMAPQLFAPTVTMNATSLNEANETREALIKFYAVIQQCRLEAERKKGMATAGQPVLAAPGGGATPAGMEPVPGSPVIPTTGGAAAFGGAA